MINWQEIVVVALLILCFGYVAYKFFLFFRGVKNKKNPCENCVTGCELMNNIKKNHDHGKCKSDKNKK